MKKILGTLLATFFIVVASCSVAYAFPKEHQVWEKWRQHDQRYHQYRVVERENADDRAVVKYRDTETFRWHGNHNFSNLRVYYSDRNRNQAVRLSYESREGHRVIETLRYEHGQYNHHKRYWLGGQFYNAYYWIGDETIIRAVVSENGLVRLSVWQRSERERYALEIGRVSQERIGYYHQYRGHLPQDVCERYIRDIDIDHNHGREN